MSLKITTLFFFLALFSAQNVFCSDESYSPESKLSVLSSSDLERGLRMWWAYCSRENCFYGSDELEETEVDTAQARDDLFKPDEQTEQFGVFRLFSCAYLLLRNSFNFFLSGGSRLLTKLIFSSPEDRFLTVLDYYTKHDPESGLKVLQDDKVVWGEGAPLFFGLRGSIHYWQTDHGKDGDAARFMRSIIKYLFIPIVEKYNLNFVGTVGDGPLLIRLKERSEQYEDVVRDVVRAGIELIVRYPEVKKRYGLQGPDRCGVGSDCGPFRFFLTPSGKRFLIPPVISFFVGENITKAYFCERSNKNFGTAMVITEKMYKLLENEDLKSVFTRYSSATKVGRLPVYAATLKDLQDLYYKKRRRLI